MVRLLAQVIGVGIETADMLVHEILSRTLRDRKAVLVDPAWTEADLDAIAAWLRSGIGYLRCPGRPNVPAGTRGVTWRSVFRDPARTLVDREVDALIAEAGKYADRLSINIEVPDEGSLKQLAPEKDVRAIRRTMGRLRLKLDEAREGAGPFLIEALTYRMGAHTTSDDPTKYREAAEVEYWKARDPLLRFETFLRRQGITQDFFDEVAEAGEKLSTEIREATFALPPPPVEHMFKYVYSEPHPLIEEQLEWLHKYEAGFGEAAHE